MDLNFPEGVHFLTSEAYHAGTYWGINVGGIIFTILAIIGLVIIIGSLIHSGPDEFFIIIGFWIFILFGLFALIEYTIVSSKDNIVTLRPLTPVPWEGDKESN